MAGMNVLGKSWAASIDRVFGERERLGSPIPGVHVVQNWEVAMGFAKLFFHSRRSGYKHFLDFWTLGSFTHILYRSQR